MLTFYSFYYIHFIVVSEVCALEFSILSYTIVSVLNGHDNYFILKS